YWGATGGGALGTAQRVFDVTMEGNLILDDYDINADVGPQTEVTKNFPVTMTDGTLNLNFDATGINGVDQPKLSAIEIIGNMAPADPPVAVASSDVTSGDPDLTVNFTGSNSTDATSFSWDFDDGGSSTLADPQHVFTAPGVYNVELTVTGPGGSDMATVQITVNDPVAGFVKRINAGGPALSHSGLLFEADQDFDGGRAYTNASAEVADLYKTERSSNQREFDYNVPLADGQYEVILHFAEIYWGATGGGTGGAGSRIFDVAIEGTTLLDDYDINVDVGPQTEVTKTFIVTVSDGTLNLAFNALDPDGVDQPKLSAMEILGIVSGSGAKENSDAVSEETDDIATGTDLEKDPIVLLGVRVYPNPAVDEINIEVSNAQNGVSEIYVHDMLGRLVATYKASDIGSGNIYLLPIHRLEGGVYNISIVDGKGIVTSERMIVKD
ncbi:MAG: malectin domain-containing carbohydrate-binding protein, partial [Flavobacteriaceae bacterium]